MFNCLLLFSTTIDTEANRQAMPDADYSKWTKREVIADTIKNLADTNEVKESFIKL